MKTKRMIQFLLALCAIAIIITGCAKPVGDKKLIVCTIYPEYDWVMNVLGDKADEYDVRLMLDGSADLHSYQPTAKDIMMISTCDVLVYVGGESDSWVVDALKTKKNKDMLCINLMEVLGEKALDEEITEGMMTDNHSDEEEEKDEHLWLSLSNAMIFTDEIARSLVKLSPEYSEELLKNSEDYKAKLSDLDKRFKDELSGDTLKAMIFADRFPFLYMAKEYDLEYFAAFSGCSADSEANFETITFLAGKVNDIKANGIVILENSDERLAKTILKAAKAEDLKVYVIDSMQSVDNAKREKGYSYLSAMESNLEIVKELTN